MNIWIKETARVYLGALFMWGTTKKTTSLEWFVSQLKFIYILINYVAISLKLAIIFVGNSGN